MIWACLFVLALSFKVIGTGQAAFQPRGSNDYLVGVQAHHNVAADQNVDKPPSHRTYRNIAPVVQLGGLNPCLSIVGVETPGIRASPLKRIHLGVEVLEFEVLIHAHGIGEVLDRFASACKTISAASAHRCPIPVAMEGTVLAEFGEVAVVYVQEGTACVLPPDRWLGVGVLDIIPAGGFEQGQGEVAHEPSLFIRGNHQLKAYLLVFPV